MPLVLPLVVVVAPPEVLAATPLVPFVLEPFVVLAPTVVERCPEVDDAVLAIVPELEVDLAIVEVEAPEAVLAASEVEPVEAPLVEDAAQSAPMQTLP